MDINERREEILKILADREYVTVEEFSKGLGVSAVTIRTDLTSLEESGLLIRTHGGAMKSSMKGEARLITNTMIENEVEKICFSDKSDVNQSGTASELFTSISQKALLINNLPSFPFSSIT